MNRSPRRNQWVLAAIAAALAVIAGSLWYRSARSPGYAIQQKTQLTATRQGGQACLNKVFFKEEVKGRGYVFRSDRFAVQFDAEKEAKRRATADYERACGRIPDPPLCDAGCTDGGIQRRCDPADGNPHIVGPGPGEICKKKQDYWECTAEALGNGRATRACGGGDPTTCEGYACGGGPGSCNSLALAEHCRCKSNQDPRKPAQCKKCAWEEEQCESGADCCYVDDILPPGQNDFRCHPRMQKCLRCAFTSQSCRNRPCCPEDQDGDGTNDVECGPGRVCRFCQDSGQACSPSLPCCTADQNKDGLPDLVCDRRTRTCMQNPLATPTPAPTPTASVTPPPTATPSASPTARSTPPPFLSVPPN